MRSLIVFEDARWRAFAPLVPLRGVFDLRCGARTLLERIRTQVPADRTVLLGRADLRALLRQMHADASVGGVPAAPDETFDFVNARLLALGRDLGRLLEGPAGGHAVVHRGDLVAARCRSSAAQHLLAFLESTLTSTSNATPAATAEPAWADWVRSRLPGVAVVDAAFRDGATLLEHAWDLVHHNSAALHDDHRAAFPAGIAATAVVHAGAHVLGPESVHLGADVRLAPGVVVDASDGPVLVDTGTVVQPNSVLRGPLYVGPGCLVKAGAKLHPGSAIGPVCKVGGEIEDSIMQGYSNKQHEGFLGHAYLGEWVNLGADTNNSDLKNNYSSVRVWEAGEYVDSGEMFVGLTAADHVKSAIDTQFNTGTVVGLASQVFGAGFPPKYVPPFSWGGAAGLETYDCDKALHTARVVMQRRQRELTGAYEAAFRLAFAKRARPF